MPDLAPAPNIVPHVSDLIGKPFKLGGRGPDEYDCYGLLLELGRRCDYAMPDYNSPATLKQVVEVMENSRAHWQRCERGPGALVAFRLPGLRTVAHVGFVLPFDRMIHVWEASEGVCVERLSHWNHRIDGFYRPI